MTFVLLGWIALASAGYFIYSTQQIDATRADAERVVERSAREAVTAIGELRAAQQAYVATGQGIGFWAPRVAATTDVAKSAIAALRQAALSPEARSAADQASAAINEFVEVDKRARDYVHAAQTLMAGDVIFTEGGQLTSVAGQQVEQARQAERHSLDAAESALRKQQAIALASAAGIAGGIALLLAFTGGAGSNKPADEDTHLNHAPVADVDDGVVSHAKPKPADAPVAAKPDRVPQPAQRGAIVLKVAADLATDFGRVRDSDELGRLLGRAADIVDATGLIVWMASPDGLELRPALAHGYAPQMLARLGAVAKTADNAAASAYRTGKLQIVLSQPGGAPEAVGAIVAPILGVDGCIGALSAEIKNGGEGSEAVQAVATIVAAHLAGVLASSVETAGVAPQRAAQA